MNWLNRKVRMLIHAIANRSVTLRATLTIVAFSLAVGALFAVISIPVMEHRERDRLETGVAELASTVSSTVSVAAYVSDATIAKEVAHGLLTNRSVAEVTILAGHDVLVSLKGPGASARDQHRVSPIVRKIVSPFDAHEIVGELRIHPAAAEIRREAAAYARYLGAILALQAAALAAVVARVVLSSIVRPIKNISDDLHRLQAEQGQQLSLPKGNERNEIGRLARDVNSLISKLVNLLSSERQLREERESSERQLRLIIENAENGIFIIDGTATLRSWNPAFARELRLPPVRPAGAPLPRLDDLLAPHGDHIHALVAEAASAGRAVSRDFEVHDAAGSQRWLNVLLQPIESHRLQGMISDVTAHKRAAADAIALAEHDQLTGLANRRGMEAVLRPLLAEVHSGRRATFALMMIDLDWFKQVNDTYGHEAGDEVLRVVASRLRRGVRPGDTVARVGGDEFVLVLNDVPDAANAGGLGERLIASVSEPISLSNGAQAHVGASIGVAFAYQDHDTLETLMKAADAAMYEAKQAGRARCRVSGIGPLKAIG